MFGRTVTIDGREVFVSCTPKTPYSEICLRAAKMFKEAEEAEQYERDRDAALDSIGWFG